eukprot:jgi/Bigna1/67245/fgenesh1_pg.3_\
MSCRDSAEIRREVSGSANMDLLLLEPSRKHFPEDSFRLSQAMKPVLFLIPPLSTDDLSLCTFRAGRQRPNRSFESVCTQGIRGKAGAIPLLRNPAEAASARRRLAFLSALTALALIRSWGGCGPEMLRLREPLGRRGGSCRSSLYMTNFIKEKLGRVRGGYNFYDTDDDDDGLGMRSEQDTSSELEAAVDEAIDDDPEAPVKMNWTEEFRNSANSSIVKLEDLLKPTSISTFNPSKQAKYDQIKDVLKTYRGPIRLNDKFVRMGWAMQRRRIPNEVEAKLIQGDPFERKGAKSRARWALDKSRNDEELFKALKFPNALTQACSPPTPLLHFPAFSHFSLVPLMQVGWKRMVDRIWFEAPRMQMLELRNGTWDDVGIGILRLHSSMHWERDFINYDLQLKNTRWIELIPFIGRPPIFSARLNPHNIRYDPTPVRMAVRVNIYDPVLQRVRLLAFRQLPRELPPLPRTFTSREPLQAPTPEESEVSTYVDSDEVYAKFASYRNQQIAAELADMAKIIPRTSEYNETQGYHDISPFRTAVRLIDELPHLVPAIPQIVEVEDGTAPQPMILFQQNNFRLWRFVDGEWRDWSKGRVEVFRLTSKTGLRFLASGSHRQIIAMALDRSTYSVDAPVHRGVMLSGPAQDATGNISVWTVIFRATHDTDTYQHNLPTNTRNTSSSNETTTLEPDPKLADTWGSRRAPKPWHYQLDHESSAFLPNPLEPAGAGRLEAPAFRNSLESYIEESLATSFSEKQLEASRLLIHALQFSRCRRFRNITELIKASTPTPEWERSSSSSTDSVSDSTESSFTSGSLFSTSDLEEQIRARKQLHGEDLDLENWQCSCSSSCGEDDPGGLRLVPKHRMCTLVQATLNGIVDTALAMHLSDTMH